MVYTKNLILVCTGRDTTKAASLGMPVLQLCLGISQSGALQRLKVSAVQRHCLLGVTDPPQAINFCSAERIAADLVFEARRTEAPGVFADFEHDTPLQPPPAGRIRRSTVRCGYSAVCAARVRTHAVARDTHGLHRDFGRQSDRVHFLPAGHLQRCADCRVSAAGFAGFSPCRHPRRTAFHSVPQQEPRCSRRPARSRSFRASCARNTSPTWMQTDRHTLSCTTMIPRWQPSWRSWRAAACRTCSRCFRMRQGC